MKYLQSLYYYLKYSLYALYVIGYLGLWTNAPNYIETFDYTIRSLISIILIISFNPFTNVKLTRFHSDVAFSAGIIILLSLSLEKLTSYIENTYQDIREVVF